MALFIYFDSLLSFPKWLSELSEVFITNSYFLKWVENLTPWNHSPQFYPLILYSRCMLCDNDSKEILTVFVQSFVRYLGSNSEKFFNPELDYEAINEEYKMRLLQNPKI